MEAPINVDVDDTSGGGINDQLKILGQAGSLGRLHHLDGPVEIRFQCLCKDRWIDVLVGLEIPRHCKSRPTLFVRAFEKYIFRGKQINGHDKDLSMV